MPRVIFESDHDLFRETARRFIDNEIVPHVPEWGMCITLHVEEYPIARAFRDARVQTIYGGTNEIMKDIVGRSLGL